MLRSTHFHGWRIVVMTRAVHQCGCSSCQSRDSDVVDYHGSINRILAELDERNRRLFAGMLARQIGRGGIARIVEITGISRMTVRKGLRECEAGQPVEGGRIRKTGGGRQRIEKKINE